MLCGIAVAVGLSFDAAVVAPTAGALTEIHCGTEPEPTECKVAGEVGHEVAEREERREAQEKQAREAAERETRERQAREAVERETREREAREAAERQLPTASTRHVQCVVPRLKGDSLITARRALHGSHCALGSVTGPTGRRRSLVVVSQGAPVGRRLPFGAAVGVKLGKLAKAPEHG